MMVPADADVEAPQQRLLDAERGPQIQAGVIWEPPRYCCRALPFNPHLLAWALWAGMVGGLAMAVASGIALLADSSTPPYLPAIGGALFFVFAVAYVVEGLLNRTSRALWNIGGVDDVASYVDRMRAAAPAVHFVGESYHFERRSRTVHKTTTDSHGKSRTESFTEYYEEKVVTHRAREPFRYDGFDDLSGELSAEIYLHNACRIDFKHHWFVADDYTAREFDYQWHHFDRDHRHRDQQFHSWKEVSLPGFRDSMIAVVDAARRPRWMAWWVYAVFTFVIPLSPVYRLLLDRGSAQATFVFSKRVHCIPHQEEVHHHHHHHHHY